MDTKKMSEASLVTDGVVSLFIGVALLFLTGMSQSGIVLVVSAYAMILGITQMLAANGEREEGKKTGYLIALGLYSLIAGIGLLFFANAALSTVITLVGSYIIITGVAEVIAALAYREEMGGYAWLVGAGSIRAIFGVFLLLNTGAALEAFILYLAVYAIVEGFVMIVFGYEVGEQIGKYHQEEILQ